MLFLSVFLRALQSRMEIDTDAAQSPFPGSCLRQDPRLPKQNLILAVVSHPENEIKRRYDITNGIADTEKLLRNDNDNVSKVLFISPTGRLDVVANHVCMRTAQYKDVCNSGDCEALEGVFCNCLKLSYIPIKGMLTSGNRHRGLSWLSGRNLRSKESARNQLLEAAYPPLLLLPDLLRPLNSAWKNSKREMLEKRQVNDCAVLSSGITEIPSTNCCEESEIQCDSNNRVTKV